MFRVLIFGKSLPFKKYSEAMKFKLKNGGTLAIKVGTFFKKKK